jgi:hypothetical protein
MRHHHLQQPEFEVRPVASIEEAMQLIDDCPDCKAARERGEPSLVLTRPELMKLTRSVLRRRYPRWRDLKRIVRR